MATRTILGDPIERAASTLILTVDLTDPQALALAQYVKRVGLADLRVNASTTEEAYQIRDALGMVQRALEARGYAPR